MFFSRSASALRVARRATGVRAYTMHPTSPASALQAAFPHAKLPPHPNFVGQRSLPRDATDDFILTPHYYMTDSYTDFPDGMNEYLTPVVLYFQEIQDRWDAISELIKTKDKSLLAKRWYDLFPSLVRATRGIPAFSELAWRKDGMYALKLAAPGAAKIPTADAKLKALVKDSELEFLRNPTGGTLLNKDLDATASEVYALFKKAPEAEIQLLEDLENFVTSEQGLAKLEKQKEKLTALIQEYLKNTPTVLTQKQIDKLLGMTPEQQSQWLWEEYGFNLEQRAAADNVSPQQYIKSLGLTDAKTLDAYLHEIEQERAMILRYKATIPSAEADKEIQAHLDSKEAKDAMAKIRAGDYSSKDEAVKLLDAAIGVPKKLISDTVLKIIRDVPVNTHIEGSEKDQLRADYFSPEYGSKIYDPLGIHEFYQKGTTSEDPYKFARFALGALLFSVATTLVIIVPEHRHYVHENHELPGNRSASFWKSQEDSEWRL